MRKKQRKIRKHYTITVTSDYSVDKTKSYRSRFNVFKVSTIVTIFTVLLGVGLTIFEFYELGTMESKLSMLRGIIDDQEQIITELGREKAELSSQNQILNSTVAKAMAEKEKAKEEDEKRHFPTAFPLTGAAIIRDISVMDEPEDQLVGYFNYDVGNKYSTGGKKAVEENPIAVFEMSSSSDVVATADGRVIAIKEDEIFKRQVLVDHGNGYITIYRNQSDPKVSIGDEIVRGTIIFIGGEENIYLGYQIKYQEEYVDPMQIMVIQG